MMARPHLTLIAAFFSALIALGVIVSYPAEARDEQSQRAERIREIVAQDMGNAPPACAAPVTHEVTSTVALTGYTRADIIYQSCGALVPAYLLIPDGSGPFPGVVAMHQTIPQGRDEVVGIKGSANLAFGLELVLRGYVVIAPDMITAGSRVVDGKYYDTSDFYAAHPSWSAMGAMLNDHKAAVSVLASLPMVDSERIGSIGHSLGGHNSLFLGAFDPRIKAVVANGAYERMATDDRRDRWSRVGPGVFTYFPLLREFVKPGSTLELRWDFEDIVTLIGPKPLFQSFALQDAIWTVPDSGGRAEEIANSRTGKDTTTTVFYEGGHDFPPAVRQRAHSFLDGALKR